MAILNKTGITNGGTIQAEHVTRTIDALTGVSTDTIVATGSFTGSFTGPLTGTASFATTTTSASFAVSSSRSVSSSFATTASYALNAIGSGTEYMTLRLSSGLLSAVPSGSAVYIGAGITGSASRTGIMIPFTCTIVSASFNLNTITLVSPSAILVTCSLWSDVNNSPTLVVTGSSLDPRTLYLDAHAVSANNTAVSAQRFINASFIPTATTTGSFIVTADILIKKT